ncbi:hypothetical protein [Pedobacter sp. UYP30]|uniref:hypothetical protein n=1 Tax=Pedobacter sp. UYP30 TaxID=1756400 RepID=UPI003391B3EA
MQVELTVDEFSSAMVIGSITKDEYKKFIETERPLIAEQPMFLKEIDSLNKKKMLLGKSKDRQDQFGDLNSRWSNYASSISNNYRFLRANGGSAVSAFLLLRMMDAHTIPLDSVEIFYNKFPQFVKNSVLGKTVEMTFNGKRKIAVGSRAPALNAIDISGKSINSEEYAGGNMCC